jgi:hypothetical protein
VSALFVPKEEVAVPPKDEVPKTANVLVAVAAPKVAAYAVAFVAMSEGVVSMPAALIVVVPVAPKEVRPKKLAELAKEEAPRTVSAGVERAPVEEKVEVAVAPKAALDADATDFTNRKDVVAFARVVLPFAVKLPVSVSEPRAAVAAKRLVEDAVVAKRVVEVAAVPVAFTNVKL